MTQPILFIVGLICLLLAACSSDADRDTARLFHSVPPSDSGIDFSNTLRQDEAFNIIEYLYYYNGGGVAVGDVNNDGLPDVFFTANQGPNQLYLNKGDFRFENVTEQAGVAGAGDWSTGVTMADVNGDGWLDIYVCQVADYKGRQGRNELYVNQNDGTFREQAADYGLDFQGFSTQAAFFDYDQDGDLDVYLLNHSVHSTENYVDASIRGQREEKSGDCLYRNDGGRFTNVSQEAGIYGSRVGFGLGIALGDLDDDGCPDIYVSNDFHENDYLYYNNCDGTFREAATASLGHTSTFSMGSDINDFNNDGWLDILSLDMKPDEESVLKRSVGADPFNIYQFKLRFGYHYQFPRNMLQYNQGRLLGEEVQFSEIGQLAGIAATDWSWSTLFCDLDLDGWKDIFVTNGIWRRPNDLDYLKYTSGREIQRSAANLELAAQMPPGLVANRAFKNEKDLRFSDQSVGWGLDLVGASNGAAYADLDNDGDLDLVVNNLNAPASLFRNTCREKQGNHFLQIRLQGEGPNTYGIGSRVRILVDGLWQTQEMYPSRGFQSAVEPRLTFGLGTAVQAEKVQVRWPGTEWQEWQNVPADQLLFLKRSEGEAPEAEADAGWEKLFEEVSDKKGLDFRHRENAYIDFDREILMPHMLSTQGPKMAVADVNGDGLDDLYICGARGQSGRLFLQSAGGAFRGGEENEAFLDNQAIEETAAVFFDADQDGDPDLYVVSGGGEIPGPVAPLHDRLYLNDGRGRFSAAEDALPEVMANGACVVPLDFNGDGALDIFLGSRSVPGHYGRIPDSYLLQNDGSGKFTDVSVNYPELARVGMVTDAGILKNNGKIQLVVVGEWMPVTIFTLENGQFKKEALPQSNGWWNTVEIADLDGDGDPDLLLGNLGLNADLHASPEQPIRLYLSDFDGNRSTDPILTYYKNGREYTYFGKDELSMQLVEMKKKFQGYAEFSESTFQQVFDVESLKGAVEQVAYTLASSYAENRGEEGFILHPLPRAAQFSPIFAFTTGDFDSDGRTDALAVGNLYDVQPALGRYDASFGLTLLGKSEGGFSVLEPRYSGFAFRGEGRDVKAIRMQDGRRLVVVARNNGEVGVFMGGLVGAD